MAAIIGIALLVILVGATFLIQRWEHATERTYYGPHTDLLRVDERVTWFEDPVPADSAARTFSGIVREESAWDEDSCDPDRPIKIELPSGELVWVPRRILRR
jgi:hypothetical protein